MKRVHRVCTMLRRWDSLLRPDRAEPEACELCPAREVVLPEADDPGERYGVRGCRLKAQEFVNIVRTGNPWGKRGRPWPPPPRRRLRVVK